MKLAVNATVEAETYPAGTATRKVKDAEHRKVLEANDSLFETPDESTTSVGAGAYDDKGEWTKAKLQESLDSRNADLPDEEQVKPEGSNRDDLVAALTLLDERHPVTA